MFLVAMMGLLIGDLAPGIAPRRRVASRFVVAPIAPSVTYGVLTSTTSAVARGANTVVLGAAALVLISAAVVTFVGTSRRIATLGFVALSIAFAVPEVYTTEISEEVYGPGGVEDGRLTYGYPYLPGAPLLDLPAHLLLDAAWSHAVGLILAVGVGLRSPRTQWVEGARFSSPSTRLPQRLWSTTGWRAP
jgi:hypothetical protein